jgi:hypothetical protein
VNDVKEIIWVRMMSYEAAGLLQQAAQWLMDNPSYTLRAINYECDEHAILRVYVSQTP